MLKKRMLENFISLGGQFLLLFMIAQVAAVIWRGAVIPKAVLKARLSEMTWTIVTPYGDFLQHNTPTAHELALAAKASALNFWVSQGIGIFVIGFPVLVLLFLRHLEEAKKKRTSDSHQDTAKNE